MTELRVQPGAVTSGFFRIRGQRSRWRYGNNRLTPEHCEVLRNVNISEEGITESRFGYSTYNATPLPAAEAVVGLWQGEFSNGTTREVVVSPTKVYADDGTTRTNITGTALTGGNDNRVRFSFIRDRVIIDNGVNIPQVWDGVLGNPCTDLAAAPFTKATDSFEHNNLYMVVGTTEGGTYFPTRIRWCDIDRENFTVDIGTWPVKNLYEVYDGGPKIIGAVDNWGMALIFKADGLYPGQIVFGPLGHFDFRLSRPKRGFTPISRDSIVARPEFVLCAAREGLVAILNTGTEETPQLDFQIVNSDDVKEWLNLNRGRWQYTQAFIREKDHQVRLLASTSGNADGHDAVLVWDWETGDTWLDFPVHKFSYGASIIISNQELDWLGALDGSIYKGNSSSFSNDNGTGFTWRIKMAPNDLGITGEKHILSIRTFHKTKSGQQSVDIKVHVNQGRDSTVIGNLVLGTALQWNEGNVWDSGLKWPGAETQQTDFFVNRICKTIAPEWTSSNPSGIEGYFVEYIPLEG
jgi:hypothetical protein